MTTVLVWPIVRGGRMEQSDGTWAIEAIARVVSPYREKFGIPRQSGLVEAARGWLVIRPDLARPEAFEGLDGFSHIWVLFGFHACAGEYRLRVRPPRLGGNREVGVFASRSPFRPNNLGLSVLGLEGIEGREGNLRLRVNGLDLLHDTPVFDIKPYLPYSDCVAGARSGYAAARPDPSLAVVFSRGAEERLALMGGEGERLRRLITQTLALDPRPAYRRQSDDERHYGMRLEGLDVRWRVVGGQVLVDEIVPTAE